MCFIRPSIHNINVRSCVFDLWVVDKSGVNSNTHGGDCDLINSSCCCLHEKDLRDTFLDTDEND